MIRGGLIVPWSKAPDLPVDLVRLANTPRTRVRPARAAPSKLRPSVQPILDSLTGAAAFARNARLEILATNHLGRALYAPVLENPNVGANLARFVFLDPAATPPTATCPPSSANCPSAATSSAPAGPPHNVRYYRSDIQPFHHPSSATSTWTETGLFSSSVVALW
jgi:hypothetical protein